MYDQKLVEQIFGKEYFDRIAELEQENRKLAHYTSAKVALSIIENKTIWLNNVQYMNDYSEIEIGHQLLLDFYNNATGTELKGVLEEISTGCTKKLEFNYNNISPKLMNTYALCLTEHLPDEDKYGRLSMWRAYAANNGVALVFNIPMFLEESLNTSAMTIPMFYFDQEKFCDTVHEFTKILNDNKDMLKQASSFNEYIFKKFLITVLSMKHKGFQEEREWRILCNSSIYMSPPNEILKEKRVEVNGAPRIIKTLNFADAQYKNIMFNMNDLIYKVIIGPSNNAEQLREIFVNALSDNGVKNADDKVICSNIPIRI